MSTCKLIGGLVLFGLLAADGLARQWTDSTGRYSVEADLIAFNQQTVVLKKENHDLVAVPIARLSQQDQQYLKSKDAEEVIRRSAGQLQTWTMQNGLKVVGKVVDYGRKELVIQRRRGKVYVNDRQFTNLPQVYQRMIPKIVAHFDKSEIDDAKALELWSLKQEGQARRFPCEGVVLELENGDEYAVPFFFFSQNDLKILQPGWERWLAAEQDQPKREQQSFLLQSQAEAYQRDHLVSQQIAMMQLEMLAYSGGLVDLWEVRLFPNPGVPSPPLSVVVPARDSRTATQEALARYPGFTPGPASKVRRKY